MTEPTPYLSDWWRWWSNPLINIHPSQQKVAVSAQNLPEQPSHLLFLELRSSLSLTDKPDENLEEQHRLRSLALGNFDGLTSETMRIAALSLDSRILQTNAQQWESNYGIRSAHEVRSIIQFWNQIPHKIKPWQDSLTFTLANEPISNLDIPARASLVLGAYVMSFYPDFYKRWALTLPYDITRTLRSIDPVPQEYKSEIDHWLESPLNSLHERVLARYPSEEFEIDLEESESEANALNELIDIPEFNDA